SATRRRRWRNRSAPILRRRSSGSRRAGSSSAPRSPASFTAESCRRASPARKPGKLPRKAERVAYGLESGKDSLEVHADAFAPGETVLVVDDVLATGGTANAAAELAEKLGARVVGISVFIELVALGGRGRLGGRPLHAVLML